ncbi:hypothetical protein ARMSODRAFT_1036634 [Armillaria solidipes]|uniref:Uncharacterized protein n=1 Tax=Armillaria solidipes TaxID=1076256 RepID=A0A2H3ATX3_9AGAR|nr:hypothetical protein ARMSODRAFT_1091241 [Armillaria solidipes]PBK58369.1 hypothetical protein ARMSODRAFT_1036634 [Armillaria solidipes]
MVVGTIYLQRNGWIFLDHSHWGDELQSSIGRQDPNLAELFEWGESWLIPTWSPPSGKDKQYARGSLLDLDNRVMVKVVVTDKPNALISLVVHGSGVTSMLVARKAVLGTVMIRKVGMCNLPAYVLAQTNRSGTLCVGVPLENEASESETRSLSDTQSFSLDLCCPF